MALSFEHLLAIARNYWRADTLYHSRTDNSPEHERLGQRWEEELKKLDRWWAFLDELKQALPAFTIGDATATPDACFRCAVYSGGAEPPDTLRFIVVGCVSILAPVYTVYGVEYERIDGKRHNPRVHLGTLPSRMSAPAQVVARKLEDTFGVSALPRELAEASIPLYVEPRAPPQTTLFHALFTSEPESLP